jgi:hypothetical protein
MPSSSKAPNVAKDIESDMKTKYLSDMDCIIALISIAGLLWVRFRAPVCRWYNLKRFL